MRWEALLVVLLLLTAGCIGTDEDVEPTSDDTNTTTEDPVAPGSPGTTRTTETFDGQIAGVGTPVVSVSPGQLSEGQTIEFTVPNGTQTLELNLTTDGGATGLIELDMLVGAPGCEFNSGCEESVTTSGGEATWTADSPDSGTWTARFFVDTGAAVELSYALEAGKVVPSGQ